MRVVSLGERIEIKFHLLIFILLVNIPGQTFIAARNELRRGLDRVLAQMLLKQFVCDPAAPELVGFSLIFRPRRFLTAQFDRRIAFEIDRLFQQLFYFRHAIHQRASCIARKSRRRA